MKKIIFKGGLLIACLGLAFTLPAQCEFDEVNLSSPNDDYNETATIIISAWNTVEASNQVFSGADVTYTSDGTIRLDDGFFAEYESDFWAKIGCITATETPRFATALSIFPNPASAQITIRYNLEEDRKMSIHLINAIGQQVKTILPITQQSTGDYQYEVSLDAMAAGLYFIQFDYIEGRYAERLIKVE